MRERKRVLSLAIFVAAFAAMAGVPTVARADLGALVPAYFYPINGGHGAWDNLDTAAHTIPLTAIFNPNSGPGDSYNSDYGTALTNLEAAGGKAIAYIYTDYGYNMDPRYTLAQAEANVTIYIQQYGSLVNGFFLDGMSNDPAMISTYYAPLYQFIKTQAQLQNTSYQVVGNPGTTTDQAYLTTPTADTFVTFENFASAYPGATPPSWVNNDPASRFANIIHDQTSAAGMVSDIQLAAQRNVGSIYVTDQPYSQLPSYWDQEVHTLASVPEPSSLAIVLAMSGLFGMARFARQRLVRGS